METTELLALVSLYEGRADRQADDFIQHGRQRASRRCGRTRRTRGRSAAAAPHMATRWTPPRPAGQGSRGHRPSDDRDDARSAQISVPWRPRVRRRARRPRRRGLPHRLGRPRRRPPRGPEGGRSDRAALGPAPTRDRVRRRHRASDPGRRDRLRAAADHHIEPPSPRRARRSVPTGASRRCRGPPRPARGQATASCASPASASRTASRAVAWNPEGQRGFTHAACRANPLAAAADPARQGPIAQLDRAADF